MENVAKRRRGVTATILCCAGQLCCFSLMAHASPPFTHATGPARWPVGEAPPAAGRLDLRAPRELSEAAASELRAEFPSARRNATNKPVGDDLPALGNSGFKTASRAEELARRFHREGLPIARLWESHSALVSLGLSPRGKPGIWLIQKVP
jgi:hypothetical protein